METKLIRFASEEAKRWEAELQRVEMRHKVISEQLHKTRKAYKQKMDDDSATLMFGEIQALEALQQQAADDVSHYRELAKAAGNRLHKQLQGLGH
jgi:hypothetical protein